MRILAISLMGGALFCGSAAAQEDGKALLERVCTKCHALTATLRQHNSREQWSGIVDDMVARGADATDDQLEKIIDYLAKVQGPKVFVNKANAPELARVLGVPLATASEVVEYRAKHGAFKSFDEFKKTPALDGKNIDGKKELLDFSEPE